MTNNNIDKKLDKLIALVQELVHHTGRALPYSSIDGYHFDPTLTEGNDELPSNPRDLPFGPDSALPWADGGDFDGLMERLYRASAGLPKTDDDGISRWQDMSLARQMKEFPYIAQVYRKGRSDAFRDVMESREAGEAFVDEAVKYEKSKGYRFGTTKGDV